MIVRAKTPFLALFTVTCLAGSLWGCTPTIVVQTPSEPITINLNIKHEITVKVDKDLEDLFEEDDDIF